LFVEVGEELVEQVGAVGLVVFGGVVVLALQGGPELDAGLDGLRRQWATDAPMAAA
jgi:hypothetical protein